MSARWLWTQKQDIGPSPRYGHGMEYDATRQRVVLFSGSQESTTNDTWEWDGSAWTQVADMGPSPRLNVGMTYDAFRQRLVLFGGWVPALTLSTSAKVVGDTWERVGSEWTQVADTGPAPRKLCTLTYDPAGQRVVLFGGFSQADEGFNDTWEWDGMEWTQIADTGPSARYSAPMVFDGNCSATDSDGYTANGSFKVTVKDTTPPEITGVPADQTVKATSSSGAVVTYTSPTAKDKVNGNVTVNCSPASGATFPLGTTTVNCSATDTKGNTAKASFKVSVLYGFTGFFQPVDDKPIVNVGKADNGVPVYFGLSGNMGLNVFETGYPKAIPIPCDSTAPVDTIEQTVSVKTSLLTYDASLDRYRYAWKTERNWMGTCRQLVLRFKDGTAQLQGGHNSAQGHHREPR
jgi:hypothetical protein